MVFVQLTVGHSKNEPKNDIKDKTMHETSKITKIKLDDTVNISNMNSCSTDNKMECDDTNILTEHACLHLKLKRLVFVLYF
jgi:hypothetical protein